MSNPAVVPASDPGSYGICIAFDQRAYETSPVWTRIDDPTVPVFGFKASSPHHTNCAAAFTIDRGRAYEMNKTEAGTASLTIQDPNGLFDPTNASSPFYGKIGPMLRVKISVQNPNDLNYYDLFTGFVESWKWTMDTAEQIMTAQVGLVDGFEPLTRAEIQPEPTGRTIFLGTTNVQTRIDALLDLAGWPTEGVATPRTRYWRDINTGNVFLKRTVYNPQTSVLSGIQDAADAEFPGVANFFMSKRGAATFYGRYPRFQPTNYPDNVNFWQVADASGADAFGAARISDIEWGLDQANLINACLCYPDLTPQTNISNQLFTNSDSINLFGVRTLSLPDLIVDGQPAGGGISPQPAATDLEVCLFYAQYYVENYKLPQLRIQRLEFKSQDATDSETWSFITGVEIGDLITVFTRNPGGGGFSKETDNMTLSQFYVEGVHYEVAPLNYPLLDYSLRLDVSPRAWFTTDPWTS